MVLVGEYTEMTGLNTQADTDCKVLLGGLEPGVALCLFEDMVEDCVVGVVIHLAGCVCSVSLTFVVMCYDMWDDGNDEREKRIRGVITERSKKGGW